MMQLDLFSPEESIYSFWKRFFNSDLEFQEWLDKTQNAIDEAFVFSGSGLMPLHAQKKGKRGEEEFCEWLSDKLGIEVQRNLKQSRGKGSDIIIDDFLFEVKRREELDLDSWWHQVCVAQQTYKKKGLIPIVAFRQNRKKWEFLIPAKLIPGLSKGYLRSSERVFLDLIRGIV